MNAARGACPVERPSEAVRTADATSAFRAVPMENAVEPADFSVPSAVCIRRLPEHRRDRLAETLSPRRACKFLERRGRCRLWALVQMQKAILFSA
mmetsp:Transcript_4562/g.13803  ORF Transcript_4562/g.13803 Transcript_4562/m.13803 type:complete len:95 (-) Transcript_4562:55-339(-)